MPAKFERTSRVLQRLNFNGGGRNPQSATNSKLQTEKQVFATIHQMEVPCMVALTKCDMVPEIYTSERFDLIQTSNQVKDKQKIIREQTGINQVEVFGSPPGPLDPNMIQLALIGTHAMLTLSDVFFDRLSQGHIKRSHEQLK